MINEIYKPTTYTKLLLEKMGKEQFKLKINEMKYKLELLTPGMKVITLKCIKEMEATLGV